MTQDTPTIEKILSEFNSAHAQYLYPQDARDARKFLRTNLTTYGNARYEEGVREERERMCAEVMRILGIQQSGVRPDTDFEKGHTTAHKNMPAYLSDK